MKEEEEDNIDNDSEAGNLNMKDPIKAIYNHLTIKVGLKISDKNYQGWTPLMIAARSKNMAFLNLAFEDLKKLEKN